LAFLNRAVVKKVPTVNNQSGMNQQTGKYIIVIGLFVLGTGILIYLFHNKLNWLGRLPGDIRIEKENFKFYFPLTTMLLLSILLTLIINIIRRI